MALFTTAKNPWSQHPWEFQTRPGATPAGPGKQRQMPQRSSQLMEREARTHGLKIFHEESLVCRGPSGPVSEGAPALRAVGRIAVGDAGGLCHDPRGEP